MKEKLKVGQQVLIVDNTMRITQTWDGIIKSVGRKYFDVVKDGRNFPYTFYIDSLQGKGDYSSMRKCYLSKEDYDNEILKANLTGEIRKAIGDWGMTSLDFEQIKQIHKIIFP